MVLGLGEKSAARIPITESIFPIAFIKFCMSSPALNVRSARCFMARVEYVLFALLPLPGVNRIMFCMAT